MHILLIGSGGREHALAWKLAQSPLCSRLSAAPGNPGIAQHAQTVALDIEDHTAVARWCAEQDVALVVVGPEQPLVAGIADALAPLPVFGPSKAAAQLEGSKGFVKDLCAAHDIPTAAYARHNNRQDALADLGRFGLPVVIKADGLAAGKGVVIAMTDAEARAAVESMFDGEYGGAGAEVVIEQFLKGEEASLFVLTDGTAMLPIGSAQDHKRVGDRDTGPNTGGMGAYSPATVLSPALEAQAMREIVEPTLRAMREAGTPYSGVLYAGLMLTDTGPMLIEYNCRFGDPECQVLMPRLRGDLAQLMLAAATGKLADLPGDAAELDRMVALTVVVAARGYPGTPAGGGAISLGDTGDALIFHAGTKMDGETLVASGGRVLGLTACGQTVRDAQQKAYAALRGVAYADGFWRRDIGWREIARENARLDMAPE